MGKTIENSTSGKSLPAPLDYVMISKIIITPYSVINHVEQTQSAHAAGYQMTHIQ